MTGLDRSYADRGPSTQWTTKTAPGAASSTPIESAVSLDRELAEREPQPVTGPSRPPIVGLEPYERVEDALAHLGRNADSRIRHSNLGRAGLLPARYTDDGAPRRVANGVLDEVGERAAEQILIGANATDAELQVDPHVPLGGRALELPAHALQKGREIDVRSLCDQLALVGFADVEQVENHPVELARRAADLRSGLPGPVAQGGVSQQDLGMQIHRVNVIFEVMDDESHEPLFLQLQPQQVVALVLDEIEVLAQFGPHSAQFQDRLHTCDELRRSNGLGQEIVPTRPQRAIEGVHVAQCRKKEHGDRRALGTRADLLAHREAVDLGHSHVQHDTIGALSIERRDPLGASGRGRDPIPLVLERVPSQQAIRLVVVDDQDQRRWIRGSRHGTGDRCRPSGARSGCTGAGVAGCRDRCSTSRAAPGKAPFERPASAARFVPLGPFGHPDREGPDCPSN